MVLPGWPGTCVQHEPGQMKTTLVNEREGGQVANKCAHNAFTFVLFVYVKSVNIKAESLSSCQG